MSTTNKRQLRLVISAVLESRKIDDLALESLLSDAVFRFVDETGKGKDPAKSRGDIVTGMLHFRSQYAEYETMSERIEKALRLHPDGGDNWNAVIDHCNKVLPSGETIEKYAEWLSTDKFNSPKSHHIAINPRLIIATWPQAFKDERKPIVTAGVFYG